MTFSLIEENAMECMAERVFPSVGFQCSFSRVLQMHGLHFTMFWRNVIAQSACMNIVFVLQV